MCKCKKKGFEFCLKDLFNPTITTYSGRHIILSLLNFRVYILIYINV